MVDGRFRTGGIVSRGRASSTRLVRASGFERLAVVIQALVDLADWALCRRPSFTACCVRLSTLVHGVVRAENKTGIIRLIVME